MRLIPALLISAAAAGAARAQCPDGTPPPCRGARSAAVARPLDDRNWLVLPFDNIARDPSLEVVRDVSVTLLYSAMSQWTDILVVDDTRVADLMRGVPAGTRLGQESGFDLARRVGAGKLVMGTLLKEGARTRVQAAVFDVRSGRRLRSPSAMTVGTDSLSAVFAALAHQVLAVPAPPGARPAEAGTTSTEALRAYAAGLDAERRLASDTAVLYYRRAVALDSTFGLAHYHLVLTLGDIPDEEPGAVQRALEAAQRFSPGIPRRERGQVAALLAARRGELRTSCDMAAQMLATDSLDAWAWWLHGNCRRLLLTLDTGTVMARFRSDNLRLADWRRAAALDSTLYGPVNSALGLLTAGARFECRVTTGPCPDEVQYSSAILIEGDSLVYRPRLWSEGRFHELDEPGQYDSRRRRFELARVIASRFLTANPSHIGAHNWMALILMNLNDLDGAERELAAARGAARLRGYRRQYYLRRFELELMRGRPAQAAVFADSIYDDPTAASQPQAGSILGRYSLDANTIHRGNDSLIALRLAWLPVHAGVLPPDWDRLLPRYAHAFSLAGRDAQGRDITRRAVIGHGTLLAFYMTRSRPAADTAHPEPLYRFQAWVASGDTARAREALRLSDSRIDRRPLNAMDDGAWLFNAEAHVLLGDSAGGLARLRHWVERWPRFAPDAGELMSERGVPVNSIERAWGRIWLLYADLAMAAGSRDEARRAYRFVVDLWERGEAPVQPLVARARLALARLQN